VPSQDQERGVNYGTWIQLDTDTELLMTPFDRPKIRHAGLFIHPWLYSIFTVQFCSANLTLGHRLA